MPSWIARTSTASRSSTPPTRLSARRIRHTIDASLRRLRTDHVDLCQMHHVDRATSGGVGLAWLLAQDGVTGPVIGPRTSAHLDGALRALALKLDEDTLAELDRVFPAPGPNGAKPAPEAYAW
ncbi:aldo/keto reductase [Amycolatopsis carbonis]|uniref:Aldo/keto reductase n=1 Tax=Amycolatopsis carbonis TaxID=715471 RepID=A0A9Y2IM21_9PSEU|nr:aldo/keto reductase [Amycolatopsis sp. 2-15]WIX81501.1 aldo/keto reductase [Amycolatopsis sp. 2-15]